MRYLLIFAFAVCCFANSLQAQNAVADPPAADEKPQAEPAKQKTKEKTENEDHDKATDQYVRVKKSEEGKSLALQTAIVRYKGKKGSPYEGQIVDLVGVVHIGEGDYYRDLNKRLSKYDTVLYELVAPNGTRIHPEDLKKRRSLLSSVQTGMKDMLQLQYQLELIDYMAENFRHADMTPDEFSKDLKRRGDSVTKMLARMMGAGLASSASSGGDAGILLAMFSKDRPKKMKQAMARQIVDIEILNAGINDTNGENTLIKGRNAKCFRILKEELEKGKKKVAVFYGAGHLPDMAYRLEQDFIMQERKTTWLNGWDLTTN